MEMMEKWNEWVNSLDPSMSLDLQIIRKIREPMGYPRDPFRPDPFDVSMGHSHNSNQNVKPR